MTEEKKFKVKRKQFSRDNSRHIKRLSNSWRKPRGLQSKRRKKVKGKAPSVSKGFRTPKKYRGLTRQLLKPVNICNAALVEKLDKNKDAIIVARVGLRKKLEILKTAEKNGIKVLNIRMPYDELTERIKKNKESQKKSSEKTTEKMQKRTKESEDVEKQGEKKMVEKKKLDKILTRRDSQN